MKVKLLHEDGGLRHVAVVLDKGEEVLGSLVSAARQLRLTAASLTAIGAFREVTLGWFDRKSKDYRRIHVAEQVEVLSLVGDVAVSADEEPKVHAHLVVGHQDGSTRGGHLLEGYVWPTLEVVLVETPTTMRKIHDPETGLALIDLNA